MEYLTLEKYYYKNHDSYEAEYLSRYTSNSSKVFNLPLKTSFSDEYNVFIVYTSEVVLLIDRIYRSIINRKNRKPIADTRMYRDFYNKNLLLEELIATNEIEGVTSSKKDLLLASSSKKNRFHFLTNKYDKLIRGEKLSFDSVINFRTIYDELMTNEIDLDKLPDGKLFRKNMVNVFKADGTHQIVHEPFHFEKDIIRHLELLIEFINLNSIPDLIKIAISHYYFEYIHPFYDGNGRTGRYIASSMISDLDIFLSLKLSKIIKENQKEYLDAFITTKHGLNRGDMTPFVIMFLNMLLKATIEVDDDIDKIEFRLKRISDYINNNALDKYGLREDNLRVLFIIAQSKTMKLPIKIDEIANVLSVSYQTARKQVNYLVELELVSGGDIAGTYNLNDDIYLEMIK